MRRVIGFSGGAIAFLWLDVAIGHVSAGLKHPGMWLPLVWLPCAVIVTLLTSARPTPAACRLFRAICQVTIVLGIVGLSFHLARFLRDLRGSMAWGVIMRLMRYPPLLAPLAISGLGMLGLLVMPHGQGGGTE